MTRNRLYRATRNLAQRQEIWNVASRVSPEHISGSASVRSTVVLNLAPEKQRFDELVGHELAM